MDLLYIILIVIAVVVIYAMVSKATRKREPVSLYRQQTTLFTAAERSFLGVLDKATEGKYRVFGKVRVADVLTTTKGLDNSARTSAFNRIKAKHFDFILCDPKTLDIKAAIELNDKSHRSERRTARDEFLRTACADAGFPLKEVQAQRSYSVESVRQLLSELEVELHVESISIE